MPIDICQILVKNGFGKEVNEILDLEDAIKDEARYYAEAEKKFTPQYTYKELLEIFPEGHWMKRNNPSHKKQKYNYILADIKSVNIEKILSDCLVGKRGKYCCPFHKEKNPSISIHQKKNTFKCFGCHIGGSGIDFVMKYYNLDVKNAINFIGGKYL